MFLTSSIPHVAAGNAAHCASTLTHPLYALGQVLRQHRYRFVTPTPATIARVNERPGNEQARDLAGIFGWNRPFSAEIAPAPVLDALRAADAVEQVDGKLRSKLRVSSIGEQLYFHSAYPTTPDDAVFFGPDTYRFVRQLQLALPSMGAALQRCADIGCGSGAGAIALALACPNAVIHALDINAAALKLTSVNAALAGVANVIAEYSDLLHNVGGEFDLIVANPPFLVDRDERAYRHGGGPLGGALSLAIVDAAIERLTPGGTLLLYTASAIVDGVDALRDEALARLQNGGLVASYEELDPDIFGEELEEPAYARTDRIAAVWLKATKPMTPRVQP
ncbi:MAG: SAM-dependent methyltransferase [Massilia sp.]|jgi:methylase of polypeptide subunit release factors|nr:SAM-dependent methyltransferase [Massilia sp.]